MSKFYWINGVSNLVLTGGNSNLSEIKRIDGKYFIGQQKDHYWELKITDYNTNHLSFNIPFRSTCVAQDKDSVSIILEEFLLCVLEMFGKKLPVDEYSQASGFPLSELFLAYKKNKYYYDNIVCNKIHNALLAHESYFSECSDDLLFANNKKLCYSRIKDIFALGAQKGMVWLERE